MKTRDDFAVLFRTAADPNKAAEALADLSAAVTELYDTADANAAKIGELNDTVAGLRDSNMRLFLRVTGTGPSPDEPDATEKLVADMESAIKEKFN